jgi:hypothetical protein
LPNRSPKSAKYCLDFHKRSSRRKKSVKFWTKNPAKNQNF